MLDTHSSVAFGNGSRNSAPKLRAPSKVLVLNASYEPINVCSSRRAVVLVLKRKAEVLEASGEVLHSERTTVDRPAVIRLVTYVRVPRDVHRRRITRKAVLARDSWTCQYCGDRRPGLTIDHVVPRSRGGESIWENIVAACGGCNRRKGNRLPEEIQMHPKRAPRAPSPTIFISIASPAIPTSWTAYIPGASVGNVAASIDAEAQAKSCDMTSGHNRLPPINDADHRLFSTQRFHIAPDRRHACGLRVWGHPLRRRNSRTIVSRSAEPASALALTVSA